MDVRRKEAEVREKFLPKLARVLAKVPFAEDLLAAYYCALDKATPLRAKGILLGALAYFILPVDVVPDIVLGLGFTDDLAVLAAAFNVVRNHVTEAHRARAREALERLRRGAAVSA
ncbi:YkvA family protein [Aestuariivirga sp.]|uniref:YkvA family protein n=1 Tax=Aestuariivirga sp. TaxID=2650926 RepID=UPI0039188725